MTPQHTDEKKGRDMQIEIYRRMTPSQRIEISMHLYWTAREMKAATLRSQHPDWNEERVCDAVREAFLYATS